MRVLVIEDEPKIAHAIKQRLERESYAVDVVSDGIEGYDRASVEQVDVIILDIMLPGMDGIEICKKLREQHIHTPILLLTSKSQIEDKVTGFNSGADDYLTKPFEFVELLVRIKALTRRPQSSIGTVLFVADLSIDTTNYEVKRAGKKIRLSNKEYSLLEYLVRHKNKVVTKEQIINHVWNYDANVLPNSVEVYIKHVRTKIDEPFPGKQLIHTIKGFSGYKISEEP
ncbi:MAG TPA: response regulator transcription factor [Candidatus Saccharimonadales bacterium]|nr:response regulator transcription factor [Candidatus Saccharimonadales bacterium]